MKNILLILICGLATVQAQDYFPNNDDISAQGQVTRAITNATVVVKPGQILKNATIVFKDGKIISVGRNINIPKNAVVDDAAGNYLYPSFIESYGDLAMKEAPKAEGNGTQYDEGRKGYYWNDHIRPEQRAMDFYRYNEDDAKKLMEAGYGIVQTHLHDGIARGNGMLLALNNNGTDADRILKQESGNYFSFDRSRQSNQNYPTSLMGTMALLRQSHFDADWYAAGHATNKDISLEALNEKKGLVQFIEAGNKKNLLRADKVGDRIGKQFTIIGGTDAYEMIDAVKATNAPLIVPMDYPDAYDVSNPYLEWFVDLEEMREWKQAPANVVMLEKNGITYALTTHGLKDASQLHKNVMRSMQYGYKADQALAALTTTPAQLLGISNMAGTLEKGKLANFIMTSGPLFEEDVKIYENWVQGSKHVLKDRNIQDIDGSYTMQLAGKGYDLQIENDAKKATLKSGTTTLGSKLTYENGWFNVVATQEDDKDTSYTRLVGQPREDGSLAGTAFMASGAQVSFRAVPNKEKKKKDQDEKDKQDTLAMGAMTYPNLAFGSPERPAQETILYRNATVWTNEDRGILKNTDVLVKDGKIAAIGENLNARGARVIDATGKHLTSGIIDEHSHIAIDQGVNEAGHNSTAEVIIEDVVDHEDINIYRNLAGGVTSAQLLHGSANPIGGRSALIKLKWGYPAADMIYNDSPKFIKFALGENVKQSRYRNGVRFPQTRMGVEQVFEDFFTRAKEYKDSMGAPDHRYDEEMETLVEILDSERFITCHSYVQSEINMLMKLAEKHGFNINTFTHILEGYKVADKMAAHGAGGSTFSDWWAYKYEVNDAIPFNGAIMHAAGVTVAFNSDDAEMSRRLNQEAAKAMKYGGVSEEEAWKFVTLNPAKLLHLDGRTGSIKAGKDADLVLWNGHPMSVTSSADYTMVDGIIFFSKEEDLRFRESVKEERQLLINEMLLAKNEGMKTQTAKKKEKTLYKCETIHW